LQIAPIVTDIKYRLQISGKSFHNVFAKYRGSRDS